MPLYQLFAIAKPTVPLSALATAMRRIGNTVFSSGGTLQDIRSYGEQALAYEIKTQTGKYAQGQMFLMNFNVAPKALKDLDHDLRVNEDILRWVTVKMEPYQRLPRTRKELTELHNALKEAKSYPYPYVPEGYEQEDADMAIGAPFSPETDHGTGSSPQPWR